MNLSTHIAVGAAVGYLSKNPALGFFAGLISHHLIDQIPHTDGGSFDVDVKDFAKDKRILTIVSLDLIVILILGLFIFTIHAVNWAIIFGAIGAALPDLVDNMPFWSPFLRKKIPFNFYHRFHEFFHFTITDKKFYWVGIMTQILLIALSLKLLI